MAPSDEAMAAAEKLVGMKVTSIPPDCTLVVAGVELYSVNASQGFMAEMYDTVTELQAGIATAIDDHTADLRAEVEVLRARVALLEGWNVGTEPPPPVVSQGSDDCQILVLSTGFYSHKAQGWIEHQGGLVEGLFWRYTKAAQERLSE